MIIDATVPLHPAMAVFEGDPPFEMSPHNAMDRGEPYNLSRISMGSHTGTHIDAPRHYLPNGATVDQLPLGVLMGKAVVVDVTGKAVIDVDALIAAGVKGSQRVLFKTSGGPYLERGETRQYCALLPDAAEMLVQWGVKLVGIDQLSVENHEGGRSPVHHILLGAGIVIIEGLRLSRAPAGDCEVICLPLAISGGDGAPARVVLRYR